MLTLAVLYAHFATDPMVAGAVRGMGAASAGLIVATAFKLVPTLKRNPLPLALCGAAVVGTWVLVGLLRVPMAWVVLGLGAAMVVFGVSWLRRRTT